MSDPGAAGSAILDQKWASALMTARRSGVPLALVAAATARRLDGDWRGACAAAAVDVGPGLAGPVPAEILDDLRRFAPDLLRWHLPRSLPGGLPQKDLIVSLAEYGPATLVVRTPPVHWQAGERLVLDLVHRLPARARRWRWTGHRHLWDATRSSEYPLLSEENDRSGPDGDGGVRAVPVRGGAVDARRSPPLGPGRESGTRRVSMPGPGRRSGAHRSPVLGAGQWSGTPAAPGSTLGSSTGVSPGGRGLSLASDLDPFAVLAAQDAGDFESAWRLAGIHLTFDPDDHYRRVLSRLPVDLIRLTAERGHRPDEYVIRPGGGLAIVVRSSRACGTYASGVDAYVTTAAAGTGLPVLPHVEWARPLERELLRLGAASVGQLHPLVQKAFGVEPQEVGPDVRQVDCQGTRHRLIRTDSGWVPVDHDGDQIRTELFLALLDAPPNGCVRALAVAERERLDDRDRFTAHARYRSALAGAVAWPGPVAAGISFRVEPADRAVGAAGRGRTNARPLAGAYLLPSGTEGRLDNDWDMP